MSDNSPVFESSTMKHIAAARDRQRRIIAEMEEIERGSALSQTELARIYYLREEYNGLVDKQEEVNRRPLPDPLEVLPPELWPDIMPENVGDLLVLSLVCTRWRDILFSIPRLWSTISLNAKRQDYLTEAAVCFALSAPLAIKLTISLPSEEWKKVAPLVVAERYRVSCLNIASFGDPVSPTEGFDILSDFGGLANLVSLSLPGTDYERLLYSSDSISRGQYLGLHLGYETLFSQSPSLTDISGSVFTAEQLHMLGITRLESLSVYSPIQNAIEALVRFPKLKTLQLVEGREPEGVDRSLPKSFDRCFSSMRTFAYYGFAPIHAIRCAGSSLMHLEARYVPLSQLPEVIASLHLFPHICQLDLFVDIIGDDPFNRPSSTEAIAPPSIKNLTLFFRHLSLSHLGSDDTVAERQFQA